MRKLPRNTFSQNGEDLIILDHINEVYPDDIPIAMLDIGAFNGITLSNTYLLLSDKKTAFCIYYEPDKAIYRDLVNNIGYNDNVRFYNEGVGKEDGKFTWYDSQGDMVGSINPDHATKWGKNIKFTSNTKVDIVSVSTLFERHGDNFTFINLDVEGNSADLFFEMFPLFPSTLIWSVEHDGREKEIKELTKDTHKVLEYNGENIIIAKK